MVGRIFKDGLEIGVVAVGDTDGFDGIEDEDEDVGVAEAVGGFE